MSNRSKDIIGREIRIMIAEPWDFSSDAGENVIVGEVTDSSSTSDPYEWIKCKIVPFMYGGMKIREVALVQRYSGSCAMALELEKGLSVGANVVYDPTCGVLPVDKLRSALQKNKGLAFLAGSVRVS